LLTRTSIELAQISIGLAKKAEDVGTLKELQDSGIEGLAFYLFAILTYCSAILGGLLNNLFYNPDKHQPIIAEILSSLTTICMFSSLITIYFCCDGFTVIAFFTGKAIARINDRKTKVLFINGKPCKDFKSYQNEFKLTDILREFFLKITNIICFLIIGVARYDLSLPPYRISFWISIIFLLISVIMIYIIHKINKNSFDSAKEKYIEESTETGESAI
jgi:hypothetical protein